ncbi:hypothetical protein PILCRDRAFT_496958 [Piloderma croceum F 1598]|uniref:Uncharacterized protein n=1 Tax=Piloderma croceum (strain F 1598) TaxID=765440 RepID=A0A0C3B5R9_PILCF|nr:hypothetical protein PILCRDRAFT_496958 [Piloderma croceum F 1598]
MEHVLFRPSLSDFIASINFNAAVSAFDLTNDPQPQVWLISYAGRCSIPFFVCHSEIVFYSTRITFSYLASIRSSRSRSLSSDLTLRESKMPLRRRDGLFP